MVTSRTVERAVSLPATPPPKIYKLVKEVGALNQIHQVGGGVRKIVLKKVRKRWIVKCYDTVSSYQTCFYEITIQLLHGIIEVTASRIKPELPLSKAIKRFECRLQITESHLVT